MLSGQWLPPCFPKKPFESGRRIAGNSFCLAKTLNPDTDLAERNLLNWSDRLWSNGGLENPDGLPAVVRRNGAVNESESGIFVKDAESEWRSDADSFLTYGSLSFFLSLSGRMKSWNAEGTEYAYNSFPDFQLTLLTLILP